jgi:hypothetical protein
MSPCLSFIYEGHLKSAWTGGSAPLLCRGRHNGITTAHCRQSTNFLNGPRSCSAILEMVLLKRRRLEGWRSRHYYVASTTTTGITVTVSLCITAAHCRQSTNFLNCARTYATYAPIAIVFWSNLSCLLPWPKFLEVFLTSLHMKAGMIPWNRPRALPSKPLSTQHSLSSSHLIRRSIIYEVERASFNKQVTWPPTLTETHVAHHKIRGSRLKHSGSKGFVPGLRIKGSMTDTAMSKLRKGNAILWDITCMSPCTSWLGNNTCRISVTNSHCQEMRVLRKLLNCVTLTSHCCRLDSAWHRGQWHLQY